MEKGASLAETFGQKARENARLIIKYDEEHDLRLWDLMTDDVHFIGPLPDQEVFNKEEYKESIKEDFIVHFVISEDKYDLIYSDGNVALVTGSYLIRTREDQELFFMFSQRFSMFFVNVEGEPLLRDIHMSNPDNLNAPGETFPYTLGREFKELVENMKDNAMRDFMTGLNNRNFFEENFDRINELANSSQEGFVMYFDLNKFKEVNDTHGHETGDFLLIAFARALKITLSKLSFEPMLMRLGGDEFILISANGDFKEIGKICRNLKGEFQRQISRINCPMTYSVGIALNRKRKKGQNIRDLISHADFCMYRCKRRLGATRD